jgi:hypothetical protein
MPKRTDIHKILIIGSGPIIIGQAYKSQGGSKLSWLALTWHHDRPDMADGQETDHDHR